MNDIMIELRHITKRYGTLVANADVNIAVQRGELMTLLGPSGCGKTTALRCITGQITPDEGQVFIDGADVTQVPTHKRELGMVFQNFALFPHMTVHENVEFPLMIRNVESAKRREMVQDTLRLIRMETYATHYPRQLSGGQQQRVGLARALTYRPKVLLLDEPLSNLDAKLREEMRFEIKDLVGRLGITAVYVTHDQAEALAMSDRVAVMNAGHVEQIGTPDGIYERPRSRFVADFIGLSNFVRGKLVAVQGEYALLDVQGLRLTMPLQSAISSTLGQEWLLFIRPNDIDLLPADTAAGENTFDAMVTKLTYLGDKIDYRVSVNGTFELRVQTDGKVRFAIGDKVRVRLPMSQCRPVLDSGS